MYKALQQEFKNDKIQKAKQDQLKIPLSAIAENNSLPRKQRALFLIEKCFKEKNPYLDIGKCGLTDEDFKEKSLVCKALKKCIHIEQLIFSNQWYDITTKKLVSSSNKEKDNRFFSIPPILHIFQKLNLLVFAGASSKKWGVRDLSFLKQLKSIIYVDLSHNQIGELSSIGTTNSLETLILEGNKIYEIAGLESLSKIYSLNISNNQIQEIKGLENMLELHTLNLSKNQIQEIKELENLPSLSYLDISGNQIQEIKGLINFPSLSHLNMSGNQIQEIKELENLNSLTYLDISDNQLQEIKGLIKLDHLQTLDLSKNQIQEIKELDNLTVLQNLILNNNQVQELKGIEHTLSLQVLELNQNEIKHIEGLENVKRLKALLLDSNNIEEITGDFKSLRFLVLLSLNDNRLKSLKGLEDLVSLRILHITNNLINDLNPLFKLEHLEHVSLDGNLILDDIPEEVIAVGWNAIKDRLKDGNLIAFKEVKVLLLGNPNVGKSNLLEYLETRNEPINNITTYGIQYKRLEKTVKGIKIHCWDFGGQEYFHATHQLFFSPGGLHLILWSTQDVQRNINKPEFCFDLSYWIRSVERLIPNDAKNKIEVVVAENKIDLNAFKPTPVDQIAYVNKYENINFNFTNFSLKPPQRLSSFFELFQERVEALCQKHPLSYSKYYKKIQDCQSAFIAINEISNKDYDKVKTAMIVFHNMGLLLYFPTIIPEKVFINPQLLLDLLYKQILDEKKKSQITHTEIEASIQKNKFGMTVDEVVGLLKHFDLIFQIPIHKESYFVPQYLQPSPIFIDFFQKHQFQKANIFIESDNFLMNIAMLKVFSEYGKYVQGKNVMEYLFWKDGIVIEKDGYLTMVILNRRSQRIELYPDMLNRNFPLQKEIVDFILKIPVKVPDEETNLRQSNSSLEETNINWQSEYFLTYISLDGIFFTTWNKLIEQRNKDIFKLEVTNLTPSDGLAGNQKKNKTVSVFDFNKYLPKISQGEMKKIFISYSKEDIKLVNKFIEHLSALKLDGKISDWYCSELMAGSDWNYEIQEHFGEADIVCFMISPNFMKTKYIHEHEIKKAFEQKNKNPQFIIIPIILDFCRWTTNYNNLGQFTALPYTAKPVLDFKNQNMAWYIIEECLRLVIDEDVNPTGEDLYMNSALPKDILKIYERLMDGKLDANY